MREIKFRIWDYDLKRFVEQEFNFLINSKGELFIFRNDNLTFFYKEPYEIMQHTGLKDKNGQEIYEGDILKYNFPYDGRLKHVSLVKFVETEASFGIKDRYGNEIPLYRIAANNYFEVIGNIYENEELLKSEEKND